MTNEKLEKLFPIAYKEWMETDLDLVDFFDTKGFYIVTHPEFYKDGINWNMCIRWYTDRSEWPTKTKDIQDYLVNGTGLYGDNHEFPTRSDAELGGIVLCFELLERKLMGKKLLPDFHDHENLHFEEYFYSLKK